MKKFNFLLSALFVLIYFSTSSLSAQGIVMITSSIKNYVTTSYACHCPGEDKSGGFVVDILEAAKKWNDNQIDEFSALVDEFEKVNGIRITSNFRTKDVTATKRNIDTESSGPLSGAGKNLCDFLSRNK